MESRVPDGGAQPGPSAQQEFSRAVAELLRQARRAQHLTQEQAAERTDGVVSKAALANYESRHRALRIDVFWALTRALGQDAGALLSTAERMSGFGDVAEVAPVTVDVAALMASGDGRVALVRRWFAMRAKSAGRVTRRPVTLDPAALTALGELMGVSAAECRSLLVDVAGVDRQDATATGSSARAAG